MAKGLSENPHPGLRGAVVGQAAAALTLRTRGQYASGLGLSQADVGGDRGPQGVSPGRQPTVGRIYTIQCDNV